MFGAVCERRFVVGGSLVRGNPRLRQLSHAFPTCQAWKDGLTSRKCVRAQKHRGSAGVGIEKNLSVRCDWERCEWRPGARRGERRSRSVPDGAGGPKGQDRMGPGASLSRGPEEVGGGRV